MLKRIPPRKSIRFLGLSIVAMLTLGAGSAAWSMRAAPAQASATLGLRDGHDATSGLTMRLVDDRGDGAWRSAESRVIWRNGELWLEPQLAISSKMVATATATIEPNGRPTISFMLTPEGKNQLATITGSSLGRRLAIIVDGKVLMAPLIRAQISGGAGMISGNFSFDQAKAIAAAIGSKAR